MYWKFITKHKLCILKNLIHPYPLRITKRNVNNHDAKTSLFIIETLPHPIFKQIVLSFLLLPFKLRKFPSIIFF